MAVPYIYYNPRIGRYVPSIHAILQSSNLFLFAMHNPVMWVACICHTVTNALITIAFSSDGVFKTSLWIVKAVRTAITHFHYETWTFAPVSNMMEEFAHWNFR